MKTRHERPSETHENGPINTNAVFVIHCRDNEAKQTAARFLEKLDLKPVILHERPDRGRTIIEKFEQHAEVGFAVALLTPDDARSLRGEEDALKPRERQNVIFEFGYFLGRLDPRHSRGGAHGVAYVISGGRAAASTGVAKHH